MATNAKMSIYRASEAPLMTGADGNYEAPPPSSEDGMTLLFEAGLADGTVTKRLFDAPGFSLLYLWFKPGFPLPRHSHDADCLYYIISGSLRLGTEELGPGDGFFLGAHTPYTYAIGPEGLEILEFRHEGHFTSRTIGGTKAYWDKAVASVAANRAAWLTATPPGPAVIPARAS